MHWPQGHRFSDTNAANDHLASVTAAEDPGAGAKPLYAPTTSYAGTRIAIIKGKLISHKDHRSSTTSRSRERIVLLRAPIRPFLLDKPNGKGVLPRQDVAFWTGEFDRAVTGWLKIYDSGFIKGSK